MDEERIWRVSRLMDECWRDSAKIALVSDGPEYAQALHKAMLAFQHADLEWLQFWRSQLQRLRKELTGTKGEPKEYDQAERWFHRYKKYCQEKQ